MNPVCICLFTLFAVGSSFWNPFSHRRHEHVVTDTNATAKIAEYPFVVSVTKRSYSNGSVVIGNGAILNHNWILTSANQLYSYNASVYQVRAGSDDTRSGGQLLSVSKVIIHDCYRGNYSYNVALLKTAERIRFGREATHVRLAKYAPQVGRNYTVVGYNSNSRNASVNSTRSGLHVATAYIDPAHRNQTTNITDTYFYAHSNGSYVSNGDLLVRNRELFGYYVGRNSSAYYSQSEVYAKVASLRAWILYKIKQNSKWYEMEGIDG